MFLFFIINFVLFRYLSFNLPVCDETKEFGFSSKQFHCAIVTNPCLLFYYHWQLMCCYSNVPVLMLETCPCSKRRRLNAHSGALNCCEIIICLNAEISFSTPNLGCHIIWTHIIGAHYSNKTVFTHITNKFRFCYKQH